MVLSLLGRVLPHEPYLLALNIKRWEGHSRGKEQHKDHRQENVKQKIGQ
jgi:hypothetical protein